MNKAYYFIPIISIFLILYSIYIIGGSPYAPQQSLMGPGSSDYSSNGAMDLQ